MTERSPQKDPSLLTKNALVVPPGESPDGTGQWPVLPETEFHYTLFGRSGAFNPKPGTEFTESNKENDERTSSLAKVFWAGTFHNRAIRASRLLRFLPLLLLPWSRLL
jgi:hypothetical protein